MKDEALRDNPRPRLRGPRPMTASAALDDFNQLDNLEVMRQIRATVDAYTGRVTDFPRAAAR